MTVRDWSQRLAELQKQHFDKFQTVERIFRQINPGDRIFIGTGCGEPQHLVRSLIEYVESNPKAVIDAELYQVVALGVAPYSDDRFRNNFRHNFFFVGKNTRNAVNQGLADYSPVFLSAVPSLIARKIVPIDVALVQTSPPDEHGFMSLGISVDIVKAAVENAKIVVAQINANMPRVHGEAFIHINDVTYMVPHDEPLREYETSVSDVIAQKIGAFVSRLIRNGDTIQVGYGAIPNAIMAHLKDKKNLGVHTELLTDGVIDLMRLGIVDNANKVVNKGKTVAAFCMGRRETYEYLHDNPAIEFRPVSYTNNSLVIARHRGMTAINSALEIDLTGQATAESLGKLFYSGVGGQADFMRGAVLAEGGKTILAMQSTACNGEVSRIVPYLQEGAGVTLTRGDIQYVVTEYGIAYLHGKNVRDRAMDLIAIAHPKFRHWLIEEAKRLNVIYKDQAFIPGKEGEYPELLETSRTTISGHKIQLRPVKISDEHLLKDFFYSLSDDTIYERFFSTRKDMPHDRLQKFFIIDYTQEMIILAISEHEGAETVAGVAQYEINEADNTAEVAVIIRDDYQKKGIGTELFAYITYIARRNGLFGFTAEVLVENKRMLHLFEKMGFDLEKKYTEGIYEIRMMFKT